MKQTITLIALIFSPFFSDAQEDWEFAKTQEGITVYTRNKYGYDIKEFKAEKVVKGVDFTKVCRVLLDSDSGELWIADVKDAKLLKRHAPNHTITYFELSLPWPLEGRDMVLNNIIEKSDSSLFIALEGNPRAFPEREDIIRMTQLEGSWEIKKQTHNQVSIKYTFIGDPAGSIPNWVINMFIVEGPLNTIFNLVERSKEI